ncbi:MAG: threonine synthase [Sphaerochaetaceae bacterium]|nr:threonine synthase [Sphaerochaetaceae bacterium]
MDYQSTRSTIKTDSVNAVLQGIAPDGGLFADPSIESICFDWKKCLKLKTQDMAVMILKALLPDFENMEDLVKKAYTGKFETEDLTPLVKCGDLHILELFRGPTSAFKDVALSMLPQLVTAALSQTGAEKEVTILTATSGDTGKAALEGFKNVPGTRIIVFYPDNGVSEMQHLQMATQEGDNVCVCAVKGNFDDCQSGVKNAFSTLKDKLEGSRFTLSSANSINIGRLAPQVVYYFAAYRDLIKDGTIKEGEPVDFCVPTGNFGDILAGYYAKLMGLPVSKLICASNANNVLTDFLTTGVYNKVRPFYRTESPSMDILVSSNLERLLFLACGKDTEKVAGWMKDLNTVGKFKVDEKTFSYITSSFEAAWCSQEETEKAILDCWNKNGYLCDTHTAVAYHVADRRKSSTPTVVLSTASPYKFPQAVLKALGQSEEGNCFDLLRRLNGYTGVPVPQNLKNLEGKKVRFNKSIEKNEINDFVLSTLK